VIEGMERVYAVVDDILVVAVGQTQEVAVADHHQKLQRFLERCRERSIKPNRDKLYVLEWRVLHTLIIF
jgi:hypothetical protein